MQKILNTLLFCLQDEGGTTVCKSRVSKKSSVMQIDVQHVRGAASLAF